MWGFMQCKYCLIFFEGLQNSLLKGFIGISVPWLNEFVAIFLVIFQGNFSLPDNVIGPRSQNYYGLSTLSPP